MYRGGELVEQHRTEGQRMHPELPRFDSWSGTRWNLRRAALTAAAIWSRSTVPRDDVYSMNLVDFGLEVDAPNGAPPDGGRAGATAAAPAGGGPGGPDCA